MHRTTWSAAAILCALAGWAASPGGPTPGKARWLTDGGDVQRTSWQRNETLINPSSKAKWRKDRNPFTSRSADRTLKCRH